MSRPPRRKATAAWSTSIGRRDGHGPHRGRRPACRRPLRRRDDRRQPKRRARHRTGHPPVYYVPPEDVCTELLDATDQQTHCPLKGDAHYYDIVVAGQPPHRRRGAIRSRNRDSRRSSRRSRSTPPGSIPAPSTGKRCQRRLTPTTAAGSWTNRRDWSPTAVAAACPRTLRWIRQGTQRAMPPNRASPGDIGGCDAIAFRGGCAAKSPLRSLEPCSGRSGKVQATARQHDRP